MKPEIWGFIMVGIGLFFVVSGWLKSDFFIYRLFVTRSKLFWGDNVHLFLLFSGVAICLIGATMAFGFR